MEERISTETPAGSQGWPGANWEGRDPPKMPTGTSSAPAFPLEESAISFVMARKNQSKNRGLGLIAEKDTPPMGGMSGHVTE